MRQLVDALVALAQQLQRGRVLRLQRLQLLKEPAVILRTTGVSAGRAKQLGNELKASRTAAVETTACARSSATRSMRWSCLRASSSKAS